MSPSDNSATASSDPPVDPEKGLKEGEEEEQAVAVVDKRAKLLRRCFCDLALVHYTVLYTVVAVLLYTGKSSKKLLDEWPSFLLFVLIIVVTFWVILKNREWFIKGEFKQPSQENGSDDLSAKLLAESEKEGSGLAGIV